MRPLRLCTALALVLSSTPALADSLADGSPSDLLDMDDEWVTGVEEPTGMGFLPDGRLVITQRAGTVRVRNLDGSLDEAGRFPVSTSFGEKGLLNVIAHPDYANNHIVFFYYTNAGGGGDDNRVVSIELSDDNTLDMSTETSIVEGIAAPLNHDGGGLAVDDNYLYIGTGDSGSNTGAEPDQLQVGNYYATCFTNLNGKILRLNLDGTIPSDNPLVGQTVDACGNSTSQAPSSTTTTPREEIFAWGFRNAFRVWHDPIAGNLWVGHVGEVTFEMINVVSAAGGEHHGWPFREGNDGADPSACEDVTPNVGACKDAVYRCESSQGNPGTGDYDSNVPDQCDCVTGGLILTGSEWPAEFEGQYVFGDYTNAHIWTLQTNEERNNVVAERVDFMTPQGGGPTSFVEWQGALYVTVYAGMGHIARIAPKEPEPSTDPGTAGAGAGGAEPGAGGMSMMPNGGATAAGGTGTGGTPMMGTAGDGAVAGGPAATGGDGPGNPITPVGNGGDAPVVTPPANPPSNPEGGNGPGSNPPVPNPTPDGTPGPGVGGNATTPGSTPGSTPSGEAGAAAGGGAAVGTDDAAGDDGCGCRIVGAPQGAPAGLLALFGLSLLGLRRRRTP